MKIIINDSNGHANVFDATLTVLRLLCRDALDAGICEEPERLEKLLTTDPDLDTLIHEIDHGQYITDRSGGHRIYFVEEKTDWDKEYGCNPFE